MGTKSIHFWEETIHITPCNFELVNDFLNMTPKAQTAKEKKSQYGFIRIKPLVVKEHYEETENATQRRKKNIHKSCM